MYLVARWGVNDPFDPHGHTHIKADGKKEKKKKKGKNTVNVQSS